MYVGVSDNAWLVTRLLCYLQKRSMSSNGSSLHQSPEREETCCLLEKEERCTNRAGTTVFTKKMKSLAQKKQKLYPDSSVSSHSYF